MKKMAVAKETKEEQKKKRAEVVAYVAELKGVDDHWYHFSDSDRWLMAMLMHANVSEFDALPSRGREWNHDQAMILARKRRQILTDADDASRQVIERTKAELDELYTKSAYGLLGSLRRNYNGEFVEAVQVSRDNRIVANPYAETDGKIKQYARALDGLPVREETARAMIEDHLEMIPTPPPKLERFGRPEPLLPAIGDLLNQRIQYEYKQVVNGGYGETWQRLGLTGWAFVQHSGELWHDYGLPTLEAAADIVAETAEAIGNEITSSRAWLWGRQLWERVQESWRRFQHGGTVA